ncbi:hypothetical protein N7931_05810 [Catenovulum sp. 2E275]|uniref:citrate/2-methylcitrate synthase n=1 Tax=Catenovulum sp. 2E275 TaxID=2980497 RepID=UPI0021D22573|nr:citrate/2-methylcitrate synthase [Catenovulum sp. 2E275]MCU4675145.1 hypothetical protein [Catenovulum sp. 2E275]
MTKNTSPQNNDLPHTQDFVYAGKTQTSILLETASDKNPYISQKHYLHGYELTDLIKQKSFIDTLILLFTGELPTLKDSQLLERLMIALINLGPRHPAVKSAMVAGVSKTNPEHLLPIGLSVLGGQKNGALEVSESVNFIYHHVESCPESVIESILSQTDLTKNEGEIHLAPGFGNQYGGCDEHCLALSQIVFEPYFTQPPEKNTILQWVKQFSLLLNKQNQGLLKTGLAAAVFCQLGIPARESIGLFQLICAPGIFAQGVEQTHKPITAMPMLTDEQHIYPSKL